MAIAEPAPLPAPRSFTVPGTARGRKVATATALLGAAVVLLWLATAGLDRQGAALRWPLALVALYLGWRGLDITFRLIFGPSARLGFWAAIAWMGLVIFLALFAGLLPFASPSYLPLHTTGFERPDLFSSHVLGTDSFGRDELSLVVYGIRNSLIVGCASTAIGLVVGGALGMLAGYYRGWLEAAINVVTDTGLAVPALVLLLAFVAFLKPSLGTIIIGLSIVSTPIITRLAKLTTVSYANREFVIAARGLGAPARRIILRELLPNVALPLVSYGFVLIALFIMAEASLSFLGLGIKPPSVSLGNMVAQVQTTFTTYPSLVLVPAIALFLTVLSLNRIGDYLRARWDTRQAKL